MCIYTCSYFGLFSYASLVREYQELSVGNAVRPTYVTTIAQVKSCTRNKPVISIPSLSH